MENNYKIIDDDESPYCEVCGGCGFVGCCGIESFLEHHVKGKTNCLNEATFIAEIVSYCSNP